MGGMALPDALSGGLGAVCAGPPRGRGGGVAGLGGSGSLRGLWSPCAAHARSDGRVLGCEDVVVGSQFLGYRVALRWLVRASLLLTRAFSCQMWFAQHLHGRICGTIGG